MINKENVIKAWEIFRDSNPYEICNGREFRAIREPEYCMGQMIEDTITLLKEQEPKQVNEIAQQISCFSGICPNCGKMLNTTCNKRYCGDCGQPVKWG